MSTCPHCRTGELESVVVSCPEGLPGCEVLHYGYACKACGFSTTQEPQRRPEITITQPIGNCDGSGLYEYDPDADNDEGRGAPLKERCPGCRACC